MVCEFSGDFTLNNFSFAEDFSLNNASRSDRPTAVDSDKIKILSINNQLFCDVGDTPTENIQRLIFRSDFHISKKSAEP